MARRDKLGELGEGGERREADLSGCAGGSGPLGELLGEGLLADPASVVVRRTRLGEERGVV